MRTLQLMAFLLLAGWPLASSLAADESQRPRPRVGSPDEAQPFDPLYFETAAATGGDFFWTPGEFSRSPPMLTLGADEDVLVAHGELRSSREFEVPVESGVARLQVFAGVQARAELELRDPEGRLIEGSEPGVSLQRTRLMLMASVASPRPGTWTLKLSGSGLFSVSARLQPDRAREPVEFLGFSFVELRGRPGHEGYFDRRDEPAAGETALCELSLEGAAGEVAVDFLGGDGMPLGLSPHTVAPDSDGEQLLRCPVPARPYRTRVRGRDAGGHAFQRMEAALRDPTQPPAHDR